jgi:hypothetical protein
VPRIVRCYLRSALELRCFDGCVPALPECLVCDRLSARIGGVDKAVVAFASAQLGAIGFLNISGTRGTRRISLPSSGNRHSARLSSTGRESSRRLARSRCLRIAAPATHRAVRRFGPWSRASAHALPAIPGGRAMRAANGPSDANRMSARAAIAPKTMVNHHGCPFAHSLAPVCLDVTLTHPGVGAQRTSYCIDAGNSNRHNPESRLPTQARWRARMDAPPGD